LKAVFLKCPNCEKIYVYFPESTPILKVYMGVSGNREYIYCSTKCMEAKILKINTYGDIPVKIKMKERMSLNPLTWTIVCEEDLQVKFIDKG